MKSPSFSNYQSLICFALPALFVQAGCENLAFAPKPISVYIHENHKSDMKPDVKSLLNRKPALILEPGSASKVKLIQKGKDEFTIDIELTKDMAGRISKITTANKYKRLVFIGDRRILFAPRILEAITQGRIVVELPSMTKPEAEKIARHFTRSVQFSDDQPFQDKELISDLRRVYEYLDKTDCEQAGKLFEQVIKRKQERDKHIALYNDIALCYIAQGDKSRASDTYRTLTEQPVNINLDNYRFMTQAYFFLSLFERVQNNLAKSEYYFNRLIETLDYVVKSYPATRSADWASLTIGTYELYRGNTEEARKRGLIAKEGDFGAEGYLLQGLVYEHEKRFKEAKGEYEALINNFPGSKESHTAYSFIKNLNNNRTNVEEFFNALNQPLGSERERGRS